MPNTPVLHTARLLLRRFEAADAAAVFALLRDPAVNRFLPLYPPSTLEEAAAFLRARYLEQYGKPHGAHYAICLKDSAAPIGYLDVADDESHDLGYALRREYWGRGIAAEAGRAVIAALRDAPLPYITATHDVQNPASGAVMRKLGMTYRYSYREQWQPKDISVVFRIYQRNFDGCETRVYRAYWDRCPEHFVETGPGL